MRKYLGIIIVLFTISCGEAANEYYKRGVELSASGNKKEAFINFTKALEIDPNHSLAYMARVQVRSELIKINERNNDLSEFWDFSIFDPDKYKIEESSAINQEHNFFNNLIEGVSKTYRYMVSKVSNLISSTVFNIDPGNNWAAELSYKADQYRETAPESDGSMGQFIGKIIPPGILLGALIALYLYWVYSKRPAEYFYNKAWEQFSESENSEKAISYFSVAIKRDSLYLDAYMDRGKAYRAIGKHQEAVLDFSQSVKLSPGNFDAFYERGVANSELEEYQSAVVDYSKSIALNSSFQKAFCKRGMAKFQLGDFIGVINDCSKAIELKGEAQDAYLFRGKAYFVLGKNEAAILDFSMVIELNSKSGLAYYLRGNAKQKQGKPEEAYDDWSQAGELGEAAAYEAIKSNTI
ncbi:tetratricopeptide repeat protein [Reichenbachiella sp.]|uniref:tetratricopeptide repeat protein n=1 Tax=Reichenbachiella sp. TaxID=2184521 RepID=UPI003BAE7091